MRLRLPLLISAVLVLVLTTFLVAGYRLVERTLIDAGAARAQAAGGQIAAIVSLQLDQRLAEAQRLASRAEVSSYLKNPTAASRAAATGLLRESRMARQQFASLWSGGTRVLDDGEPSTIETAVIPKDTDAPTRAGVSPLHAHGSVVFFDLAAAVRDSPASPTPLGYLVIRRRLSSVETARVVNGLIGTGARVELGNREGGLWTDWSSVLPAPAIELTQFGPASYRGAAGPATGSLAPVLRTPWLLWVEFSHDELLAPARALLGRMLALALACVLGGALLVAVVSARITTPLRALTAASEAIVAGDYTQRVTNRRADEIGRLGAAFNAMSAHVEAAHEDLEHRVQSRTDELEAASKQLEAFSYSVSHDLRAPLRAISGFSRILITEHLESLPADAASHLRRIAEGARQMGQLVDDLLAFARLGRASVRRVRTDPEAIARDVLSDLRGEHAGRDVRLSVAAMPSCDADPALLKQVYANLLSNALKFTRARADASVDVGCENGNGSTPIYFVKDNGVGFDMRYADKLFGVFQRLHRAEDYEGTGVGLAIVERIVSRHGGRVWADASLDRGACFYFTIGSAHA